jgi:hypothetical protein
VKIRLEDRYTAESGRVQMTGVQALARLPMNILRSDRTRGLQTAVFISGYEGSPLGGYDLELQRNAGLLATYDLVFAPGVNEELAATSVQGSQLAAGLDRLDPFGYTQVRRAERELIEEYTGTVDDLLGQLSTQTYQRAVEIARLPDLVRGYENIKLANVALYRARVRNC